MMTLRAIRVILRWAKMTYTSAGLRGISRDTDRNQEAAVLDPAALAALAAHPDSSGLSVTLQATLSAELETGSIRMTPPGINAPRNTMRIITRTGRPLRRLISECITDKGMKKSRRFLARPNR